MDEFQYHPLDSDESTIRLFKIRPSSSAHIQLDLFHVKLTESPIYHALSYTWGCPTNASPPEWDDPNHLCSIEVNGKKLQLRPNLRFALMNFKQCWSPDINLWVDAICIDQQNLEERGEQVQLMRQIYSSAAGVPIWLGPNPPDGSLSKALSQVHQISQRWRDRKQSLQVQLIPDSDFEEYSTFLQELFGVDGYLASSRNHISLLFKGSWWKRAWTFQEVCVATGLVLMTTGCVTGWSEVEDLRSTILQTVLSLQNRQHTDHRFIQRTCEHLFESMRPFENLRDAAIIFEKDESDGKMPSMISVLSKLRSREATEDHDKVYAGLGLSDAGNILVPDYKLKVQEVFFQTAIHLISNHKNLSLFAYCRFPNIIDDLPSWVPDWTDRRSLEQIPWPQTGIESFGSGPAVPLYSAGGRDESIKCKGYATGMLLLEGCIVDNISFLSTVYHDDENSKDRKPDSETLGKKPKQEEGQGKKKRASILRDVVNDISWLHEWAEHQKSSKSDYHFIKREFWQYHKEQDPGQFRHPTYIPTNESLSNAYLRTLAGDVLFDSSSRHEVRMPGDPKEILVPGMGLNSALGVRLAGRRLAVTEMGFLALVPDGSMLGDELAIIVGSEIPLILRPTVDESHILIGQCYVHGIMDGEIYDVVKAKDGFGAIRLV